MKTRFGYLFAFVLAAVLTASFDSRALTISSGPTFTPATNAPLAGVLKLTTDVPSRVSVSVNDGTNIWERNFFDYATVHSNMLVGFKPTRTNVITVTVFDRFRNQFTAPASLRFTTGPLPADFPVINVLVSQPGRMEPGYTLFRGADNSSRTGYVTFVDNAGQVVWYSGGLPTFLDVRQLDNGDLFMPSTTYTSFVEVNMLGQTVKTWPAPVTLNYHDGVPTDHNTILYISDDTRVVTNFPTSSTNPNAPKQTTSVQFNRIIEMSSTNNALLNNWSLIDMLDPLRISYLTFTLHDSFGWDIEHANAVIEDPRDNSIIVSMRHQNAVIKFSRAGQLKWILGPHENWGTNFQPYLLTPVGTPFEWNYAEHAPMITPQGTILLYDDGNFRASPFDASVADSANQSRAVEYNINEQTMEVSQVWEYGGSIPQTLFTPSVGGVKWLPQSGNVLVTFGNITYAGGVHPSPHSTNAAMVRIKEVTYQQPAEVVFDLALFDYTNASPSYLGCFAYRSQRVPDLYGHPSLAVADLNVKSEGGLAQLAFSGDPSCTYVIEASTDLANWGTIAVPSPSPSGTYDFQDDQSDQYQARYYRVLTRQTPP